MACSLKEYGGNNNLQQENTTQNTNTRSNYGSEFVSRKAEEKVKFDVAVFLLETSICHFERGNMFLVFNSDI